MNPYFKRKSLDYVPNLRKCFCYYKKCFSCNKKLEEYVNSKTYRELTCFNCNFSISFPTRYTLLSLYNPRKEDPALQGGDEFSHIISLLSYSIT